MEIGAGAIDPTDESTTAPNWPLTLALVGVILVALLAGVLALADDAPPPVASRPPTEAADVPVSTAATTTTSPITSTSESPPTTSTTPSTTPSTTAPPTTVVPATIPVAAPVTVPPVTAPPVTVPPVTAAPAWVAVTSAAGRFSATFPSTPQVASTRVMSTAGAAIRTELSVGGPAGSVVSVSSVAAELGRRPVDADLLGVADQVRRELGGTLRPGAFGEVAGSRSFAFRVTLPRGQVRVVVVHAHGRLVSVSMFIPGTGDTTSADAVFDRVVDSLRLS